MRTSPPRARRARAGSGLGRTSSERAERVSDDLRRGSGELLRRRRRAAGLLLGASSALGVVSLYQLGLIRHLPDPPLPGFDSDRVDASGEAFAVGLTPDGPLALVSYAASLMLVGLETADRAHERPWIPLALAGKLTLDAVGALGLTVEQLSRHRALCAYCLVAAGASVAAVPQALPEARAALRTLREG